MNGRRPTRDAPAVRSRGMALVMGLVLLTVITLLSLAGMRGITMQERMSTNLRDRNLGLQAAESALRAAQAALTGACRSGGAPPPGPPVDATRADAAFWHACFTDGGEGCPPITWLTDFEQAAGLAAAPGYAVEYLSPGNLDAEQAPNRCNQPYRVTAWAVGGTPDSVVILQATFAP